MFTESLKKLFTLLKFIVITGTFILVVIIAQKSNIIPEVKLIDRVDCEAYFSKDASTTAINERAYIAPKRIGLISSDKQQGAVVSIAYADRDLYLHSNIDSTTPLCVKASSVVGIKFLNDPLLYAERGINEQSCIQGKDAGDTNSAFAIHKIPINSLMFKNFLSKPVEAIGFDTESGSVVVYPLDIMNQETIKSIFQCAYDSVGKHIDLSDDLLLINNGHRTK